MKRVLFVIGWLAVAGVMFAQELVGEEKEILAEVENELLEQEDPQRNENVDAMVDVMGERKATTEENEEKVSEAEQGGETNKVEDGGEQGGVEIVGEGVEVEGADGSAEESRLLTSDCLLLERDGGRYYLGEDPLTKKEFREFLRVNSPDAWHRYRLGNALWWTGWGLFGASAVSGFFGLCYTVVGIFVAMFGETSVINAGLILFGTAGVTGAASVACLVSGGIYKFGAHNTYNNECMQVQKKYELSLQTSSNGIGLALRF